MSEYLTFTFFPLLAKISEFIDFINAFFKSGSSRILAQSVTDRLLSIQFGKGTAVKGANCKIFQKLALLKYMLQL